MTMQFSIIFTCQKNIYDFIVRIIKGIICWQEYIYIFIGKYNNLQQYKYY